MKAPVVPFADSAVLVAEPRGVARLAAFAGSGFAAFAIGCLKVYQQAVSPALHAFAGPACGCRFHPTCSHYAVEALREHGTVAGLGLAILRLVRCHPWGAGGFDPVPPRCVRVEHGSSSARALSR